MKVLIFCGEIYNLWRMRMEGHIMSLGVDVYSTMVSRYVFLNFLPSEIDDKNKYQNNAKARNAIIETLSENELIKVMHCKLAKVVWDKLDNRYEVDKKVKKVKLQTYKMWFEILKMKEDETIAEYFRRVEIVTNLIKNIDENFEDEIIIQKILRALPTIFNPKVSAIEEISNLTTLTMEKLLGIFTAYEIHIVEEKFESSEDAFKASKKVKEVTKNLKKLPKKIKEEEEYSRSESDEEFV